MGGTDIVQIALASNSRYLPGLLATMSSMLIFAGDRRRLLFHVLADGLTEAEKNSVKELAHRLGAAHDIDFIEMDMKSVSSKFGAFKDGWTAYMRIFLGELLPESDWVLYADVDTLWFRDVCELWKERDDRNSVCWCHDLESTCLEAKRYSQAWNPRFDEAKYACSGVALMNLKWMRDSQIVARSFEFVEKWGTPLLPDQDILNTCCMESSKMIDRCWNMIGPQRDAVNGVVLHCNGIGTRCQQPFRGYHPLYAIWFRFYTDVVLMKPHAQFASLGLRMFWRIVGLVNPLSWPIDRLLSLSVSPRWKERISRQVFCAYLMRKACWWRVWNDII